MTIYRSHSAVAHSIDGLADDLSNLEAFLGRILLTQPHGDVPEGAEPSARQQADDSRVEELQARVVDSARKLLAEVGKAEQA